MKLKSSIKECSPHVRNRSNFAQTGYQESPRKLTNPMMHSFAQPIDPNPALRELFDHFHKSGYGIAETCRVLAKILSRQVRPTRTWTGKYVHGVLRNTIAPSSKLTIAIFRLHRKIFDEPEPMVRPVTVLAPIGFVPSHALVLTRARTCALKTCQRSFVPSNSGQKFHSPTCRRLSRLRKQRSILC